MDKITKSFNFEIKASEEETGVFEGFASTFGNVDSDNDVITSGAFTDSIKKRMPKMLYQHDMRQPIGVYTDIKETSSGLMVKGKVSNTAQGKDIITLLKDGVIDSMSVGFVTNDYDYDNKTNIRIIKSLELYEISLVTFPANEQAKITNVKSADEITTIRDFERFLRDAGFSQKKAKTYASRGFIDDEEIQRDVELEELKDFIKNLNKK